MRKITGHFLLSSGDLTHLPRQRVAPGAQVLSERLSNDEISFTVSAIQRPYLIKVSFHPGWKVEGAERLYLVSPSFMLIYPSQPQVRLYYARSSPDWIGLALTLLGLFAILAVWKFGDLHIKRSPPLRWANLFRFSIWTVMGFIGLALAVSSLRAHQQEPYALLQQGVRYKDMQDWGKAERCFEKIVTLHPVSGSAEHAFYYLAIDDFLHNRWEPCLRRFDQLLQYFPDTRYLADAYRDMAVCYQNLGQAQESKELLDKLRKELPKFSQTSHKPG